MVNYYVIEMQTNSDGTSGNLVYGYEKRADAKAKFHDVARAATQSTVMVHAVAWLDNKGHHIADDCSIHTAPEPEPEPEPEPGEE